MLNIKGLMFIMICSGNEICPGGKKGELWLY